MQIFIRKPIWRLILNFYIYSVEGWGVSLKVEKRRVRVLLFDDTSIWVSLKDKKSNPSVSLDWKISRGCRNVVRFKVAGGVSRIIIRPHYEELMVHFPCQQQHSFAQRCADLCRWGSKPISMLKTPHARRKKKKEKKKSPPDPFGPIRASDKPAFFIKPLLP